MKRGLSFALVIVVLLSLASPAFAAVPDDTVVSPQYNYIDTSSVDLVVDEETGLATCSASCYTSGGYTVEVECKLQRYISTSWKTVKTWTDTGYQYASVNEYRAVHSGYTYRVYATFRVRNSAGNLIETGSSIKTCVYPSTL